MMAQAGEDIEDFALRGNGVRDAVGGEQGKMQIAREFDGNLVAALFFDGKVALEFDINIVAAEEFAELLEGFSRGIFSAFGRSAGTPSGPGGTMRMALGGQTNSHNWHETHLVFPS